MEFIVHRTKNTPKACTGWVELAGSPVCFCLEDPIRRLGPNGEGKIPGQTGIPAGRYQMIMNLSHRFQKIMPLILKVPSFSGIRWHSGNDHDDTSGCLLIGREYINEDYIRGGSVLTPVVYDMIREGLDQGQEIWVEYLDEFPEEDYQPGGAKPCLEV
jgi:hypothetical protein